MEAIESQIFPFSLLDRYPQKWFEEAWVFCKVLIKEGILNNSWYGVINFGRGHGSVVIPKALAISLSERGIAFGHNEASSSTEPHTVVVLKDARNLRRALEAKRHGRIKRIIAGPFIATLPTEYKGLLCDSGIDALIFLSEWHRDLFYRHAPSPLPPGFVWFSGIDTAFWSPGDDERNQILIFKKQTSEELFNYVVERVKAFGVKFTVVCYGEYKPESYRAALRSSRFAIFLHRSETQGLATFEAWSCGVPTLHHDPGTMKFMGTYYKGARSCPYQSEQSALTFKNAEAFDSAFQVMNQRYAFLEPRKYVLENFTTRHSAERFLSILKTVQHGEPKEPGGECEN